MICLNAICGLLGFLAGLAVYALMDWGASLSKERVEPTFIGDSTSGMGL